MRLELPTIILTLVLVLASCTNSNSEPAEATLPLTADGELDIEALVGFVEEQRDREFLNVPEVRFVTLGEFASQPSANLLSRAGVQLLALLDLVDPDFDLSAVDPLSSEALGFCCPIQVVPSHDQLLTAAIVVHELTHRLDVEVVGSPPAMGARIDDLYRLAIVEGNATRIEAAFLAQYGTTAQELREQYPIEGFPGGVDMVLRFPYSEGQLLTEAIALKGGERAIDEALSVLPTSAEQVMFPESYLAGEPPLEVEAPNPKTGTLEGFGTLGTHLLWLVAREAIGDDQARDVLAGWSGAAYILRSSEKEVCLYGSVVMESAESADVLAEALGGAIPTMSLSVIGERLDLERCESA